MYEDMYKDYSDEDFTYNYPISFRRRNKAYLYTLDPINVQWYYGDTVQLIFDLIDEESSTEALIPEYFEGRNVIVTFLNFRGEVVNTVTFTKDDIQGDETDYFIEYDIDRETSSKIFPTGIYYCGIKAVSVEDDGDVDTLCYYGDFPIRVV